MKKLKSLLSKNSLSLLALAASFLLLLRPPTDPDLGWHLKMGEFIIQNRTVPWQNLFSHTLPNYRWADSYWLTQVLMFWGRQTIGLLGLSVAFALIAAVAIFWASKRRPLVAVACSLVAFPLVGVRPLTVSLIFFAILFLTLEKSLGRDRFLWYLPPLFALWANLHADFVVGLFFLGLFWLLKAWETKDPQPRLLLTLGLSALATLINPYGIFIHQTLLREATAWKMHTNIAEWLPPNPQRIDGQLFIPFAAILVFLLIEQIRQYKVKPLGFNQTILVAGRGRHVEKTRPLGSSGWPAFPLILLTILSIRSVFYLHVLLIAASPFLAARIPQPPRRFYWVPTLFFFLLVTFGGLPLFLRARTNRGDYPHGAIDYLRAHPQEGRVFNNYDWGGYLIWNLPEVKTFVDGRMPAWRQNGEYPFADYLKIITGGDGFEGVWDKYQVSWALIPTNSELAQALVGRHGWGKIYEDEQAVILRR